MTVTSAEKPARVRNLTEFVSVRLEPAVYSRVEAAASAEGRTLSGWMRRAALDRLAKEPG